MGSRCSAPGCKGGYFSKNDKSDKNLAVFKFPKETTLKDKWIKSIPRKDWVPTENSGVCEVHFTESDFKTERDEKNPKRKEDRGQLKRKYLTSVAVPTVFPNCPKHLTTPRKPSRTSTSTIEGRIQMELIRSETEYIRLEQQ